VGCIVANGRKEDKRIAEDWMKLIEAPMTLSSLLSSAERDTQTHLMTFAIFLTRDLGACLNDLI